MEKFDGKGDFGMWKYKLMGQLEIQGLLSVLKEDFMVLTESGREVEGSKMQRLIKRKLTRILE